MVVSPNRWRSRLVFFLGALAIGVVSVHFAQLSDRAQLLFRQTFGGPGPAHWLPLLVTPLTFAALALLADRAFPGSQGSGIPQAIAARHLQDDPQRGGFLTLRIAAGKILMTVVALAAGASVGREGPTVQIGAAIMVFAARVGGLGRVRGLILAGSAAGIAAAFNTPLAGIVFAIEEMGRSYQVRTNGLALSAVIISGIASLSLLGSYTYFGQSHAAGTFPRDWLVVVVTGIAGGTLGGLFSLATLSLTTWFRRIRGVTRRQRIALIGLSCGLVVAVAGLLSGGATFGTGYGEARGIIEGVAQPWSYFVLKFLASLASTVSGIPGGLFAPSLSVGAGLGGTIGAAFGTSIGFAALIGMAAYFAGVVQAPFTTIVIVLEMTGSHASVTPIMAAAMIGFAVSRYISPVPLYHALARLWIADAIRHRRAAHEATAVRPESPSS